MKLLVLLPAAAVAAAAPASDELTAHYSFEQFQADFGKLYESPAEAKMRRGVFESARAMILAHNANPTATWKMAVNQFADVTPAEFRASHGYKPRGGLGARYTDFQIPHDFDVSSVPVSRDWRMSNVVTPVKNQGQCGSCWAFATTETVESRVAIDTGTLLDLSPQQLVSCDANPQHCGGVGGCNGSTAEQAYQYVATQGLATATDDPYTSGATAQNGPCLTNVTSAAYISNYVKLAEDNYTQVSERVSK